MIRRVDHLSKTSPKPPQEPPHNSKQQRNENKRMRESQQHTTSHDHRCLLIFHHLCPETTLHHTTRSAKRTSDWTIFFYFYQETITTNITSTFLQLLQCTTTTTTCPPHSSSIHPPPSDADELKVGWTDEGKREMTSTTEDGWWERRETSTFTYPMHGIVGMLTKGRERDDDEVCKWKGRKVKNSRKKERMRGKDFYLIIPLWMFIRFGPSIHPSSSYLFVLFVYAIRAWRVESLSLSSETNGRIMNDSQWESVWMKELRGVEVIISFSATFIRSCNLFFQCACGVFLI